MLEQPPNPSRRDMLASTLRASGLLAVGGILGSVLAKPTNASATCWQIDPDKCTWCGRCATDCVLNPSAVKCVQAYPICGYCRLCTGYFDAQPNALNAGAENQICPTGAIIRKHIEDQYYEYNIDADLCIGCAKCVDGCTRYGNGSFFLQINQELCVKCNRCSIAANCPANAISRVPASQPYKIKTQIKHD